MSGSLLVCFASGLRSSADLPWRVPRRCNAQTDGLSGNARNRLISVLRFFFANTGSGCFVLHARMSLVCHHSHLAFRLLRVGALVDCRAVCGSTCAACLHSCSMPAWVHRMGWKPPCDQYIGGMFTIDMIAGERRKTFEIRGYSLGKSAGSTYS